MSDDCARYSEKNGCPTPYPRISKCSQLDWSWGITPVTWRLFLIKVFNKFISETYFVLQMQIPAGNLVKYANKGVDALSEFLGINLEARGSPSKSKSPTFKSYCMSVSFS